METEQPAADEVRAALDRVVASEPFRHAPQLTAFLRFVVETTLRGENDRIKGYTIATEALGRAGDFDPERDPIVRIEAGRLRRALERYYAGAGATDAIIIDVARGGYVPTFRRRLMEAADAPALAPRETRDAERRRWRAQPRWAHPILLPAAALVLLGIAVLAVVAWLHRAPREKGIEDFRAGNGLPLVVLRPVETIGVLTAATSEFEGLRRRLGDALARFDAINVASEPPAAPAWPQIYKREPPRRAPAEEYHLAQSAELHRDGTISLTFTLLEPAGGTIVWSRTFRGNPAMSDRLALEEIIVRTVVTTIAEPFGVIHARERAKTDLDPRETCLLDAIEYWRSFDLAVHARVRACLERMTELDPAFAPGFAALEMVYVREYYNDLNFAPADPPALDRALRAAQRAVSVKPQSARAHTALEGAYYARGEIAAALMEGETALSLNPLDPLVVVSHATRLVGAGQIDSGAALLRQATANSIVMNPNIADFYLFLVAHLKADREAASRHANLSFSDSHVLGLVARGLAAKGNPQRVRQIRQRLLALYPTFADDPRRAIARFIPSTEIVDRLVRDLAELDP